MDTDRKVVVARTVALHIVAVRKAVSVHKVGKAGKVAWVEEDGQQEVASFLVSLPFPLLLPFLLFLLPFLLPLQLALLVGEEVEAEFEGVMDLRMAVGVVVAHREVARKVAGVGTVEHKDPWDMVGRLVHRAATFLAGHMTAAVRMRVADHTAVVHKLVHKVVVDKAVVCKTAVHTVYIAVVHMGVCHIAVEVHTDYKAAVVRTDHMVAVVVHNVDQMAAVGQTYQPFLVVCIVLPFQRYRPASFLALEAELQTLCS